MARTEQVLDVEERVALGAAAEAAACREAHRNPDRRVAVERRIDAGAAVEAIGPAEPLEVVIAAEPVDGVGGAGAVERIGAIRSVYLGHGHTSCYRGVGLRRRPKW
jgi:hypothetical protein